MQAENMKDVRMTNFKGNPYVDRRPDYWIHVFNISRQKFLVRRPPAFPVIEIPACPNDKPYIEVLRIPNIVNEKSLNALASGGSEVQVTPIFGERFAMDIINPANEGADMWQEMGTSWIDSGGDDLSRRGVFWTLNEEPTGEELRKARVWMERHYRKLIKDAEELSKRNRPGDIIPEAHLAADHFKLSLAWHTDAEVPASCPNCGEPIKEGIAFHSSNGILCVIDWKRAVASGVKKRDDVPQEKRWWIGPDTVVERQLPGQSEEEFQASIVETPAPVRRGPGRPRKEG
jgi:hypothetical protein